MAGGACRHIRHFPAILRIYRHHSPTRNDIATFSLDQYSARRPQYRGSSIDGRSTAPVGTKRVVRCADMDDRACRICRATPVQDQFSLVDPGGSGYRAGEILGVLAFISSPTIFSAMAGVPDFLDVLYEMAFCCCCRAAIPEKIAVLGLSGSFFVPTTILMRKNKRMTRLISEGEGTGLSTFNISILELDKANKQQQTGYHLHPDKGNDTTPVICC